MHKFRIKLRSPFLKGIYPYILTPLSLHYYPLDDDLRRAPPPLKAYDQGFISHNGIDKTGTKIS